CPSDCACSGTTVNCTGRGLTSIPSGIPPSTIVLLLNRNQISSISTTLLDHLDSLKTLDLSDNALTSLEEAQFAFQNDAYLDLSYNSITRINSNSFPPSLVTLNIAYNSISLWSRSLYSPVQLKSLDMRGIAMSSLTLPRLQHLSSLETLKISGPRLATVSSSLLNGLTALKNMELSNSLISSLPSNFFAGSPSLEKLSLKSNNISRSPSKIVTLLSLLKRIDLSNNRITQIMQNISSPNLHSIDLSNNLIHSINPRTFENSSSNSIKLLDLSHNQLTALPRDLFKLTRQLETLNLSHNNIALTVLDLHTPIFNPELVVWDLSYNRISFVVPLLFVSLRKLVRLHLHGNSLSVFSLHFVVNSPLLTELTLQNNAIQNLAFHVGVHLTDLDFISGNFLRFLENDTFSGLSWLRCLNLSHNRIMHIDSDALTTLPNLVTLDLSGNRLTSLGAASVSSTSLKSLILSNNFLVKIAMTLPNIPAHAKARLTGNLWNCDCEL
uniref:LRRNT domain-containing protein n=1 Tax=Ciona savignyi TaxID=51511 RepID=H2ZNX1_CIOSA